jgi:phosphomevalonate kinase
VLVVLDQTSDQAATAAASNQLRTMVDQSTPWTGGVQSPLHSFVSSTASSPKPSFLQCLMADVVGGSESPSMARQVLEWRQQQLKASSDQGSCPHWDDLAQLNPRVVSLLQELHHVTGSWTVEEQSQRQDEMIQCPPRDWSSLDHNPVARVLSDLRHTFQECRYHLRAMGNAAGGVPIEPAPQTALCNACLEIPGVVAALVPGAGGYDAVVCVYIATASVTLAVTDLWAHWNNNNNNPPETSSSSSTAPCAPVVCSLTVQGADFGQGLRLEPEFPSLATETTETGTQSG